MKKTVQIKDLKKGLTYEQFRKEYGMKKEEVLKYVSEHRNQGYNIKSYARDDEVVFELSTALAEPGELEVILDEVETFGLIGDTHLGSKADRLPQLNTFYDMLSDYGVKRVFHAGDLIDGIGVYRGQEFNLKEVSIDGQIEYCVKNYPKRGGIETLFLGGNHDLASLRKVGLDPCPIIASKRSDLVYLGQVMAKIDLGDVTLELVHYKGSMPYAICFDDKTKILSKKGWVLFKDLEKRTPVATLNNKGFFEWQTPIDYIEQEFNGKLIRLKGQAFDLVTTPNHRHWVRKHFRKDRKEKPTSFKFKTAKEIFNNFSRQKFRFKRNCLWKGKEWKDITLPSIKGSTYNTAPFIIKNKKAFLSFLGWFISEGHTTKPGRIFITQTNEDNWQEIIKAYEGIGLKTPNYQGDKFCSNNKRLKLWLDKNCGKGAENKKVPNFIKELKPELIKVFLKSLFKGDGHFMNGRMVSYTTLSDKLASDVMELLLKTHKTASLGYKHYVTKRGEKKTIKIICVGHTVSQEPSLCLLPEEIEYNGKIYCVSVPNQRILVMRNGKTCWSGNSYRGQKYLRDYPGKAPDILALGHAHKSGFFKVQNTFCFEVGAWQGPTKYTKEKGLFGLLGGWIVELKKFSNGFVIKPEWVGFK